MSADGGRTVVLEPAADPLRAPTVPRFVVTPASSEQILPDSLWLFTGELSSYYATRLERGELPDALVERQVPTLAWFRAEFRGGFSHASAAAGRNVHSGCDGCRSGALDPGCAGCAARRGPGCGLLASAEWCSLRGLLRRPAGVDRAGHPPPWSRMPSRPGRARCRRPRHCLRTLPADSTARSGLPPSTLLPPPMVGAVPLDPAPLGAQTSRPGGSPRLRDDRSSRSVRAAPRSKTIACSCACPTIHCSGSCGGCPNPSWRPCPGGRSQSARAHAE